MNLFPGLLGLAAILQPALYLLRRGILLTHEGDRATSVLPRAAGRSRAEARLSFEFGKAKALMLLVGQTDRQRRHSDGILRPWWRVFHGNELNQS